MKSSVTYSKLSTLCKVQNGYAFDSKLFTSDSNDMPLVRIRDIKTGQTETFYKGNYSQEYVLHNGDYIIGMDGEFNITEWQGGDALLNQRVCRIIVSSNKLLPKYVLYFLPIPLRKIEDETPFVTVKHLSSKKLNDIIIPVPSIEEQQRIVDELDLLSDIIDKKKAQLRDLDALTQSIFYEMFGDPITNDKGWPVCHLEEIASSQIGLTYKPKNVSDTGTVVLRSSNIQNSLIDLNDIVRVNCDIKEKQFVREGDILMCSRNGSFRLVGKVARIQNLPERMSYGAFMTIIRSDYNDYLFGFFKTPAFRAQLGLAKTATINQITVKMLNAIQLPVPPKDIHASFAERIAHISSQQNAIIESLKDIQHLFDSRMSLYFG